MLGCTHFPALAAAIRAVLPPQVNIVDSAATTAAAVARQLHEAAADAVAQQLHEATTAAGARQLHEAAAGSAAPAARGGVAWLATDGAARFARVGSTFLGEALRAESVQIIDL